MKRQTKLGIVTMASLAMVAVMTQSASAQRFGQGIQRFGQGERIIRSQVVRDEVVGGASSHVGDLPSSEEGGIGDDYNAAAIQRGYGRPDLFYNNYTQGNANRANAQMYLSPVPVPPNVGHTFYTYQPFYPQEMLYAHKDRFHNYYDNGRGMNRTRATYWYPPVKQAASNVYWNYLRIPR